MFKYRSQRVALAISVLIHLLILVVYRPLSKINILPDQREAESAEAAAPLVFELVETPDDAIRQRPDATNLLSDKNALARDEYQGTDKETGDAYSEGRTSYRVFSGQSERIEVAQSLSEVLQEKRPQDELREQLRNQDLNVSTKDLDSRQQQNQKKEASENLRPQDGFGRPLNSQQYIDDVNYDQREFSAKNLGGISLSTYAWDFASYILEMKRKLKASTYPPSAFTHLGMISGETVITFRVWPDGTATDIKVVDYNGDKSLMETSVDAVRISSPFRSLPRNFPEEYLELRWTFVYLVYH